MYIATKQSNIILSNSVLIEQGVFELNLSASTRTDVPSLFSVYMEISEFSEASLLNSQVV